MKKLIAIIALSVAVAFSYIAYASGNNIELHLTSAIDEVEDTLEFSDPLPTHRKPGLPIRCLITPTGVTLTPAIDDSEILSFDIYVDDMPVASFDDEADFCAFIFSYTGTAEIRLHTTEHTLAGFITL